MRHTTIAPSSRSRPLFRDWKMALLSMAVFWTAYLATVLVRGLLGGNFLAIVANRVPNILTGFILTGCIYLVLQAVNEGARLRKRAIVATVASCVAAVAQALLIIAASPIRQDSDQEFRVEAREGAIIVQSGNEIRIQRTSGEQPMIFTLPEIHDLEDADKIRIAADAAVVWLFFFAAWSAVYLAGVSSTEAARTRARLVEAEAAAQAAQVRALRYQVNPHFLFNTLNSLSSLVITERTEQAEQMLLALSNFFRSTLSLDPGESVTLEQEIELQALYLDIEKQRFPERLAVIIDVAPDMAQVHVPALILQPLIENAIKYGVSRTRDPVSLTIRAERTASDRGLISVHNSDPGKPIAGRPAPSGTGTGLNNVGERLVAQYGGAADFRFGPVADGWRVELAIPIEPDSIKDDTK